MNIKKSLNQFLEGSGKNKGRKPNERYTSFDYCYNYFYAFYKNNKLSELVNNANLQNSCLQIGFYLASWGMMRGSSFLLQKSVKNFSKLIEMISKTDRKLWKIDVPNYNEENIHLLLACKGKIVEALGKENNPSITLLTKIMLGVFANIPAYDEYFCNTLRKESKGKCGFRSVNEKSLNCIKEFYTDNKKDFDSFKTIYTLDFSTEKETDNVYTKAKLIDMYGFTNRP